MSPINIRQETMLLKEKITYHANFELDKIIHNDKWMSIWRPVSEKIQLDSTGEWFKLNSGVDKKAVFKDLVKMGYASRGPEYRAFDRVVKSHELEWMLKDCSYTWEVIDNVPTLYFANMDFTKKHAKTRYKSFVIDNKWHQATGNLVTIRYEESEKQSQAIVYSEFIDRKININSKNKTVTHHGELMKLENRKRAIKAKSLRDVVEVTNHNAEVLNDTVEALNEIAELKRMLAEHQAMMAAQQARIDRMEAAQLSEMINFEMK